MFDRIKIEINPLPFYNKYVSSEYTLCGIDFFIALNGKEHHFRSESSDTSLKDLLSRIDDYLSGESFDNTELYYPIPWIMGGDLAYPYSFEIKDESTWSFRYKNNQCDEEFDFVCELDRNDIVSMQLQIQSQFSEMDWDSLGKTEIYRFDFPEKEYEWCYSANAFSDALNKLCVGRSIQKIYVSAADYADPLSVQENYVNYYLDSEVVIQFEGFLLDLLILAEGLFQWRGFQREEYRISGPTLRFIEGDEDFCDIGDVYGEFTGEYRDCGIEQVVVKHTDCRAWKPQDFDESEIGKPVELPKMVCIHLLNGYVLSLYGLDDDFVIKLQKE
ncbi:MAG: hypothetical protein IKU21_06420 [Anaerotignum sp.]|nr:hypothetical protein [Anaerotignum sp.]